MKNIWNSLFKRNIKNQEEPTKVPLEKSSPSEFKGWEDFSSEELIKIAKMISHAGYGDIVLNFNDTFAYASAWGVDCDEFDLIAVSSLFEKYGIGGVIAWGAVKEDVEKPIGPKDRFPNFSEARDEILKNREQYFWQERYKKNKG